MRERSEQSSTTGIVRWLTADTAPGGWRWDLTGIALATLLIGRLTSSPSAYFLHFDTPLMSVAAQAWVRGCFGYYASQVLPVVLLAPFYGLLGLSPIWETILLSVFTAVSVVGTYELGRLTGKSRASGLLAAMLLLALPAFQYFSRTHLGYAMPFLVLGWLALYHERWVWAGLSFGVAVTAHYNSWVPVGLSGVTLAVFYLRPAAWKKWLSFGLAYLAPLLAVEVLYFWYRGHPLEWNRSVFAEVLSLSASMAAAPQPDWLWLVETVGGSNGWLLSLALGLSVLAPLKLNRDRTGLAMSLAFLLLAALYTVQAGLGRSLLVPRLLATSYAVWAASAAAGLTFLLDRVTARQSLRLGVMGLASLGLLWAIVQTGFFMRAYTRTPYPQVRSWFAQAGEMDRPVRYQGNWLIGMFYAQQYGVEALINDPVWLDEDAPGQAILIFVQEPPDALSREGYTIETADASDTPDQTHPSLTTSPPDRHAEVWWPTEAESAPLEANRAAQYVIYYSGSGCLSDPIYGYGTEHFYQLVWRKLVTWLGGGT